MLTREKTFQRYIIDKLVDDNKYIERKAKTDYNKPYALDLGMRLCEKNSVKTKL